MLNLQAGKRYVQRDGVVTLPLQKHERTGLFYLDCQKKNPFDNLFYWFSTGAYCLEVEHHLDLVEEYVDKSNWLQVGKFYYYGESGRTSKCVALYGANALMVVWRTNRIEDWYSSQVDAMNRNGYCVEMPEGYQHEPSM